MGRGHRFLLIVGCVMSLFTIAVEAVAYSVIRPPCFYREYWALLTADMNIGIVLVFAAFYWRFLKNK
jgi:hypothetical protein